MELAVDSDNTAIDLGAQGDYGKDVDPDVERLDFHYWRVAGCAVFGILFLIYLCVFIMIIHRREL